MNLHPQLLTMPPSLSVFAGVQLALGSILRDTNARDLPCGVFGSFGWSGEAVDEMEAKLKDGGYPFAFKPIRVKFKPTATVSDCNWGWCVLALGFQQAIAIVAIQQQLIEVLSGCFLHRMELCRKSASCTQSSTMRWGSKFGYQRSASGFIRCT